jgi:hypothetical protein
MSHDRAASYLQKALLDDNEESGGGSAFSEADKLKYDEILAETSRLASQDFQACRTDQQRMEVLAVVHAAQIARDNAHGLPVEVLQFAYRKAIGETTGRPSGIELPPKPPGERAGIPDLYPRVVLTMLWDMPGALKKTLRDEGMKHFSKSARQIDDLVSNTRRQVRDDRQVGNLMKHAEREQNRLKGQKLTDYLP